MHRNQLSFVVNNNITTHKAIYYSLLFISEVKEEGGGGETFSSARMRGRGVAMGLLDRGVD